MRRDTLIQLAAFGLMVVFLGGSVALTGRVSASMGRNRLVYEDAAEQGEPGEVAFGIALGAFRGVFVNYLWIRANNLKEEGKYYEAIDLAKTITRLQPRFPKVWAFHAWNLAYNISVTTQTEQERWNWVQAGIRLLREQGIPANDNDLILHKELAWIYLHKVQGFMDDAHRYYKKQHAREWTIVLGKPPKRPLGAGADEQTRRLFVDKWLRPIAEAPDTLEEVYRAEPLARELVDRLKREAGATLDESFLERFELLSSLHATAQATGLSPRVDDPIVPIVLDPKYAAAGKLLLVHVRRRVLIDRYHMEPERMIRFTEKFGPLDWRHPAAHAMYWAARGVEEAGRRVTRDNRPDFDFVNTDRLVIQASQELFRTGMLFYDIANPNLYVALPDPAFLDTYHQYKEEALSRAGVFADPKRLNDQFRAGAENFYKDAIRYLYRRGDREKAEKYYKWLRTAPWLPMHDYNSIHRVYGVPLDEFVANEILEGERFDSPPVALQEISGALEAAFIEGLLGGNTPVYESSIAYARKFHTTYQDRQSFKVWLAGQQGRLGMPPFDIFSAQVLAGLIMSIGLPEGPIMYQAAPPELRARVYVLLEKTSLKPMLEEAVKGGGAGFDSWFPPTPDVAAVREQVDRFFQNRRDAGTTELK